MARASTVAVLVVLITLVTGCARPAATRNQRPFTVVALGDSVPAATTCGCTGYVELLASRLGQLTGRTPEVHNDATDGWGTADVVRDLQSDTTLEHLRAADLVVVEAGANDFDLDRLDDPRCFPAATSPCWTPTIEAMRSGLAEVIRSIRAAGANAALRVAVVGYWNVTVDGAVGRLRGPDFVRRSDDLTRVVNEAIQSVAASQAATYVDAYTALKGESGNLDPTGHLLDDGDHPNQKGHRVLMEAILSALRAEGAVAAWHQG